MSTPLGPPDAQTPSPAAGRTFMPDLNPLLTFDGQLGASPASKALAPFTPGPQALRHRNTRSHSSPSRPSGPFYALPHQLLPLSFVPSPSLPHSNHSKMPYSPISHEHIFPAPSSSNLSNLGSCSTNTASSGKPRPPPRPLLQSRHTTAGALLPTHRSRSSTLTHSSNPNHLVQASSRLSASSNSAATDAPIPPSLARKGWTDEASNCLDPTSSRTSREDKRRSLTRQIFPSSPPSLVRTASKASASSRHTSRTTSSTADHPSPSNGSSVVDSWLSALSLASPSAPPLDPISPALPFELPRSHSDHPPCLPPLRLPGSRRNVSATSASSGEGRESVPPEADLYETHLLPSPVFKKGKEGEWEMQLGDGLEEEYVGGQGVARAVREGGAVVLQA